MTYPILWTDVSFKCVPDESVIRKTAYQFANLMIPMSRINRLIVVVFGIFVNIIVYILLNKVKPNQVYVTVFILSPIYGFAAKGSAFNFLFHSTRV